MKKSIHKLLKFSYFAILANALPYISCYHSQEQEIFPLLHLVQDQPHSVLILGDSLAEYSNGFDLQEKLGGSFQVRNISRAGWDVPLWMTDQASILAEKTDILVVELGTNDANNYGTESFPENYSELIRFLEENHNWIILHSKVPRTTLPDLAEKIRINNEWIQENYNSKPLVDLDRVFQDNANLPLYPLIDPVHPNPIGYDLIGEEYKKAILRLPLILD